MVGVDGDADVLSLEKGAGLGATTETKNRFSQELEQTRKKKAVLVSVKLVKRKLLKVIIRKYNIIIMFSVM